MPYGTYRSLKTCLLIFLLALTATGEENPKPNIVVLLTDDLDNELLKSALQSHLMPNLENELVNKGITFSQSFVSNAICCPSRATLLTGQYSHNHGVLQVKRDSARRGLSYWLDAGAKEGGESNTLATWLQSAGYRTALIGKYLNGYGLDSAPYTPQGYDDWYGLTGLVHKMYEFEIFNEGISYKSKAAPLEYQTDFLADKAVGVIEKHASSYPQIPLFLVLTPTAPHIETEYELNPNVTSRFNDSIRPASSYGFLSDGIFRNGTSPNLLFKSSVFEYGFGDKLSQIQGLGPLTVTDLNLIQKQFKDRLASLVSIDDMIGKVILALTKANQWSNTVFIFTSDNGWFYGEHRLSGKSWAYEEAIRVPLVIRSPFHAGRGTSTKLVLNNDLAPTIAELAGVSPVRNVDGRSLTPLLNNVASLTWTRKRVFIEQFKAGFAKSSTAPPTYAAIREISGVNNFLYVYYFSALEKLSGTSLGTEYYDLNTDPTQEHAMILQIGRYGALNTVINSFATCSGNTCREAEDKCDK